MTLHLTIVTPTELLVDRLPVEIVRAEDATGSFGVMAGHANLLTVAQKGIIRWRTLDDRRGYCAVNRALIAVTGGSDFRVSAREGLIGDNLEALAPAIAAMREDSIERAKLERVAATRLHAQAVRGLIAQLQNTSDEKGDAA